ncbi:MAG: type II secretory pathway pseudopilin PulG [Planctomycetota bacterium]|jgi:type II secretory pathway pseudopilin PulG
MKIFTSNSRSASGFTLAEAAITIALVGLTITYTLRALTAAQTTAAHTHEVKLAREMALRTLGEVATGLFLVDGNEVLTGTYDEEVAPYMAYEVAFGDAVLSTRSQDRNSSDYDKPFDNWRSREEYRQETDTEDDLAGDHEPFEKIVIRVSFPKHSDLPDFIELESWIPWEQVYGPDEALDELLEDDGTQADDGSQDDE